MPNQKQKHYLNTSNIINSRKGPVHIKIVLSNHEIFVRDGLDLIFKNHNINIVYHLAAYAAEGLSPFIRKYIMRIT